jgi:AraC family transcriptional regulator
MMIRKLASGTFYGEKRKSYDVDGFRLSEWVYEPERKAPWHAHETAYLNMVLQGGHLEAYQKEELACEPFLLVFHPVGEIHAGQIYGSDTRIFDIEIAPQRLERVRELGLQPNRRAVFTGGLAVWLATRLYRELAQMDEVSPERSARRMSLVRVPWLVVARVAVAMLVEDAEVGCR